MLGAGFFERDPLTCARELVGCTLVKGRCRGIIAETEAYAETGDPACHTATRPSARAFMANHPAGSAYVYFNYGMYWLFNVLTLHPRGNGFVLVRALQPTGGIELMRKRRTATRREVPSHDRWLCSGPGKLTVAMGIAGKHHGLNLCKPGSPIVLEDGREAAVAVEESPRIGISQARDFLWRFTLAGSRYVSV